MMSVWQSYKDILVKTETALKIKQNQLDWTLSKLNPSVLFKRKEQEYKKPYWEKIFATHITYDKGEYLEYVKHFSNSEKDR